MQRLAGPRGRRRRTSALYTLLTIAGFAVAIAGIAMIFPPIAFVLAGIAICGLGLVGLGMRETP